jgi:CxxC motif-containing protein
VIPENQRLVRVRSSSDELTCIVCPIGCHLTVSPSDDGSFNVTGNKCKRGALYAEEEFRDPRRVVTGTCALTDGQTRRLPVKSSEPVPVDRIPAFLNAMYDLRIGAPISMGTVVSRNLADSGIDLIATLTAD